MSVYQNAAPGDIVADIGRKAQRRRLALGVNQSNVAGVAGVGIATVRRFEAGQNISLLALVQIARALGAEQSLGELFPLPQAQTLDEILKRRHQRQRAPRRHAKH
jgi:transcriptional regulator with XRE-family HTH domain